MSQKLGYDGLVKRSDRATVVAFALLLGAVLLVPPAEAQINGVPPSVTSLGFGGHPGRITGVAPSVTSLGPRGFTPGHGANPGLFGVNPNNLTINGRHGPHHRCCASWGWGYAVPYYGYYDSGYDTPEEQPEDQYNGGPTIFDRRGPGTPAPMSYADRGESESRQTAIAPEQPTPTETAATAEQPSTVLVFRDGHQLEVENYAIVGNTLYDLTEGRRHKIALADLDLTATAKLNDARGIDFQLPAGSEAN